MNKVILALSILWLIGCSSQSSQDTSTEFPELTGIYLGQSEPGLSPEIFAPNIISTGKSEINACFSPDFSEFLYTIITDDDKYVIMTMSYLEGKWTKPKVASFSGTNSDADPFITADGKWLYFVSKRNALDSKKIKEDWDIWRVEKVGNKWSNPQKLGGDINSNTNDIYPSLTKDGTLYYSSGKDAGNDNNDLYYALSNGNGFEPSVRLNDSINTHWEGDVFISPDEDYIIYWSSGRPDKGLYISFNNNGEWTLPIRMNEEINKTGNEFCPIVSPDGKFFFFTSDRTIGNKDSNKSFFSSSNKNPGNGKNDIYWVSASIIEEYRIPGQ